MSAALVLGLAHNEASRAVVEVYVGEQSQFHDDSPRRDPKETSQTHRDSLRICSALCESQRTWACTVPHRTGGCLDMYQPKDYTKVS